MRRLVVILVAALGIAAPALAEEGGPIRTGEHEGFSRIVMRIDPATEWSLDTGDARAVIHFPGKNIDFGTRDLFVRMPRTRVRDIETTADGKGTDVVVSLGCECRLSASFVDGRYLALDVADANAALETGTPASGPAVASEEPAARATREAEAVASAENILLRQIERAADQGLIELSKPLDVAPGDPGTVPRDTAAAPAPARFEARQDAPPPPARPKTPAEPVGAGPEPLVKDAARDPMRDLLDLDQVHATTVFDRDSRAVLDRLASSPVAPGCIADDQFKIADWSDGTPYAAQAATLDRRMTGEFDRVDPVALADMIRLQIRNGFGAEARLWLASFPVAFEGRALLADMAAVVAGQDAAPEGPLAIPAPCPGAHGLWRALGGRVPPYDDADRFAAAQAAFAELPPDFRSLIGPVLMDRLLDANHGDAARLIHDTTVRSGETPSAAMKLSEARLVAIEGHPVEAAAAMAELVAANAPNGIDALIRMTRLVLDADLPHDPDLVLDLHTAAIENRHTEREPPLRLLAAEVLAHDGDLAQAMTEVAAVADDLPDDAPRARELGTRLLAAADPDRVGASAYAKTVLAHRALIGAEPAQDPARRQIARRMIDLGLPGEALDLLAPVQRRGGADGRLLAADALLRQGEPARARAALGDLESQPANALRARGFAEGGEYAAAVSTLNESGLSPEAAPYAWPSGDWALVQKEADDPRRQTMANYMAIRDGQTPAPAPAADPAALDDNAAFEQPLPPLEQPSLASARRLLTTSHKLESFVQNLLKEP